MSRPSSLKGKTVWMRYANELQAQLSGKCDHCGADIIDNCPRCGAPQCCPQCCRITELEAQLEDRDMLYEAGIKAAREQLEALHKEHDEYVNWVIAALNGEDDG